MYTPAHFSESDQAEIDRICARHPLAVLVAQTAQGLVANHIPLLRDGADFIGHIALNNDLHVGFDANTPILAIFTAAEGYVSPNWYPSKAETHKAVPTWNYQAVHVHGTLNFTHEDAQKRRVLNQLTRHFETLTNAENGWRMGDAPADFLTTMLDNIVAFRLHVTRIEAKSKLNQNRAKSDITAVADQFEAQGNLAMAQAMRKPLAD